MVRHSLWQHSDKVKDHQGKKPIYEIYTGLTEYRHEHARPVFKPT